MGLVSDCVSSTDNWISSPRAAKLFFASTFLVLALVPRFEGWMVPATRMTLWLRIFWTMFGNAGTAGLLFLFYGMWWYWVRLDESKKYLKRFWFLILLFGFWFGSCIYCYFVYLPQVIRLKRMRT